MKPQLRPHHYAPRRRGGGVRYLLAGSAGIVCVVVCLALFSHLRPTAVQAGELPEGISSSQGESSASSLNQITVTPTAEPSYALSLSTEERPWYLRLVNKENPLPQDFTVELTQVYGGQFDSRAADALSQMLENMEEQGLSPMICSSFRTWDDQAALQQDKIGRLLAEGYSQEAVSYTHLFPMAFFYLEHFLSVQDPEPSDLYLALMPISWVLSPILLAVGYLVLLVAG